MANGLAEIRRGPGLKDRHLSPTAGIRKHKLALDDRYFYEPFRGVPIMSDAGAAGGAAGTTGTNLMFTGQNLFELAAIGTVTACYPVLAVGGYDLKGDNVDAEGFELGLGITAQGRAAYTVGTDAFYAKLKFSVADASGIANVYLGFRLAEAYQATVAAYDTYGCIGPSNAAGGSGLTTAPIKIASELDGNANAVVDTTNTYTEGTDLTLGVYVDKGGNFTYSINGAAPTVTEALQATAGDVLVPFVHVLGNGDTIGETIFKEFECGLLDQNVR